MKSITIHGLDDDLDEMIRIKAGEKGLSLNKMLKALVREALGMGTKPPDRKRDFQDLFGTWSQEDLLAFDQVTEDFGRIDPKDWE